MGTVFLTNKTKKGLKKIDKFLSKEPWQASIDLDTAYKLRNEITKIEEKGYYTFEQRELLNLIGKHINEKLNTT